MADVTDHPLYYRLEDLPPDRLPKLALAIGVFDGVHRGHQALIQHCGTHFLRAFGQTYWRVAALTFDPHPAELFAPHGAPPLLGTLDERTALLHQAGADIVIVARFDRAFASLTPDEFVEKVLFDKLRVGGVVVGDDFRYGRDRVGTPLMLTQSRADFGFETSVFPPVLVNGVPARSTTIRNALRDGDIALATSLLGRPYALSGTVVHGRQLGRTIGYPTANLESTPGVLIPVAGVYAGRVHLGDEIFRAAISIGDNPTVAPEGVTLPRTVEAFLLDGFDRDIYGAIIAIDFVAYLRPMVKFEGLPALIVQMNQDVEEAKRLLSPEMVAV